MRAAEMGYGAQQRCRVTALLLFCWVALMSPPAPGQSTPGAPAHTPVDPEPMALLDALRDEIVRTQQLKLPGAESPHWVVARVVDESRVEIEASLGAIVKDEETVSRSLSVEARVGDASFDSGNFLAEGEPTVRSTAVPFEGGNALELLALRRKIWLLADASYRAAAAALEAKRAKQSKADSRTPSWSSDVPPVTAAVGLLPPPDRRELVELARLASGVFRSSPAEDARVRITAWSRRRTVVASDGTRSMDREGIWHMTLAAVARASDGAPVLDCRVLAGSVGSLANARKRAEGAAQSLVLELTELRNARVLGDWVGPVWFRGAAAPQLLELLLVPELSATPPANGADGTLNDASVWTRRVGRRVLPRGVRLTDDPGLHQIYGQPLIGGFHYDDEGMPARAVTVVRDGRLEHLLSGRIPSVTESSSNGHARAAAGAWARGRAANLWLEADTRKALTVSEMQRHLLAESQEEGTEGGLVIDMLDDPAATADLVYSTSAPVAEWPQPLVAHLIHRDGRAERVRLGNLHGLSVRDLVRIRALDTNSTAHSYLAPGTPLAARRQRNGDLPTSIVSPGFLLGDVELRAQEREVGEVR